MSREGYWTHPDYPNERFTAHLAKISRELVFLNFGEDNTALRIIHKTIQEARNSGWKRITEWQVRELKRKEKAVHGQEQKLVG